MNLQNIIFIVLLFVVNFHGVAPAGEKQNFWSGRYRDSKGYDLVVDEWEPGQLEVSIVKKGQSTENPEDAEAAFLAEIHGDVAKWSSIQKCPISLKYTKDGIVVVDRCEGARDNSGLYRRVL